jgi:hypothetical protein
MKRRSQFLAFSILICLPGFSAEARGKSTITFGRSETLSSQPGQKRSFRKNVEAVASAHEAWKKAHLNTALYSCQRNSEQVAVLARKVADKIEASEKITVANAKAMEKVLESALGEKAGEPGIPAQLTEKETAQLREKMKLLDSASRHGKVLEHLAAQVMNFYLRDVPKASAFNGACRATYPAALQKGVTTSRQYHEDALALSGNLEALSKLAKNTLSRAGKRLSPEMLATAR